MRRGSSEASHSRSQAGWVVWGPGGGVLGEREGRQGKATLGQEQWAILVVKYGVFVIVICIYSIAEAIMSAKTFVIQLVNQSHSHFAIIVPS